MFASHLLQPLRIRAYRRLLIAYAINALGMWAGQIALSILVLARTHSPAATAAVMIAGQLLPAPLAPGLVARLEPVGPRCVLPALLVGEGALFVGLAALADPCPLAVVLIVVALDGLLALTAKAMLKASMVAATSRHGLLREGNSLLMAVFTTCMAVGPVAAGITVALLAPRAGLLIDAASFALAALALIGQLERSHHQNDGQDGQRLLRQVLAYVAGEGPLRRLLSGYGVLNAASAAILPIEVVLVTRTLHASPAAYGIVLAAWGIGATVGSALVSRVRHLPLITLLAGSFLLMAISYLGMGAAPSATIVTVFSFAGGVGNGIEGFASLTAIQEATAEAFRLRVTGLAESLTAAATGLGFVAGGLTAALASPRAVYVLSGLAIVASIALLPIPRATRSAAVPA